MREMFGLEGTSLGLGRPVYINNEIFIRRLEILQETTDKA
jgi:hypothetical protein